jgi:septum formation protein
MAEPPLILASASPRRRRLLERAGIASEVMPAGVEERHRPGESPDAFATRLAAAKARCVSARVGPAPRRRVLGADTIVVVDDAILGKPRDPEHAVALLRRLMGRSHRVITAVALADSESLAVRSACVTSRVRMRDASDDELRAYVATGEPLDKAGAYALQGGGRRFVVSVEGSESNVIGLPVEATLALLAGDDEPRR